MEIKREAEDGAKTVSLVDLEKWQHETRTVHKRKNSTKGQRNFFQLDLFE